MKWSFQSMGNEEQSQKTSKPNNGINFSRALPPAMVARSRLKFWRASLLKFPFFRLFVYIYKKFSPYLGIIALIWHTRTVPYGGI